MKVHPLYLNGKWVSTAFTLRVVNPATNEPFAEVCAVKRDAVAQVIQDAHAASAGWRRLTGKARGEYLRKIADELERRRDEIARTITLENGKPLAQSLGEVAMSVDHLRWFAEEARRAYGRIVPQQADGKRHLVIKTPVGVVAAISPWNFPLVLAVRKVAPALAAGCPVILKPASATPLCAVAFAECVEAAKLPAGVFQLVAGRAAEIAQEFLENPRCRKITFTGSTEVGRSLIAGAAAGIKPLSLELGGHAPVLVFEDADLEAAVEGVMITKFRNTGQSCIASNRLYVQRSIYEEFLRRFVEQTSALKTGDGLEEGVQVGPLLNKEGLAKALEHVQDATRRGARLLCGGKRLERKGWFLEPTVLADVPPEALCMSEETFAPVAAVCAFDTEAEAIGRANASPYGLSAYAFTRDLQRAFRLMESLEAGMIGLNDGVPTTSQCPFGGVKQSGWGRELGIEGMEAFLDTKHVSLGLGI
ncbi:MAG TPA: NAD-dependent succinate-semialdehyde dehydrogenase [Candidatus Binatia bacterium]|jgi:succinate-semialdehyde dehydrogenase/glutarate-semialdehyde dehydrogenase|nr:NAD-dependent succinate-semialdehyde dehydrogenase [Candidatus Binatia bacterium]